ncbi:SusD/RagB family nutrient-binding outer membrane lipoprotein [Pedobacter sp.]|jgi:hypothetical protein|uniref:SusD/RagB family nutrient-binding outer membrane lipoprotein n=1 Tax=Pedobacter sp. TaxID=1411316 RepID=UPI002C96AC24|nr:SusD/RagB family nutrient-binding outer membrane lipoprotein [Pedobacter sp.]HWW42205.1 SusD/RagB family nutrient-binding outer membrane lipoprotein [Pedobacter sp.]
MKNIFKNNKILVVSMLLVLLSCKKLDINHSPNNPPVESATVEVLFPTAVMSSVGRINGDLSIVGGIWAQFWTQSNGASQFRTVDAYSLTNSSTFINGPYAELYSGALNDYNLAGQKALAAKDWRYNLMITVMKAYTFQVLVDLFDKVPYTEAFQPTTILQPKFDDGYTIYKSLIASIDDALAKDYRGTIHTDDQTKVDFVFGDHGNASFETQMNNWEKFANTLKLKMYLRMVNAKPAEAEAGIKKLYQDGAKFLDVNAGVNNFVATPDKGNPFYEYNFRRLNTPDNLKASVTLTSWLDKNQDPRAEAFFATPNPVPSIDQGDYLGGNNDAVNPVVKVTDPAWLISLPESYFMQAEARERYFGVGSGAALYQKGLSAAFAQAGLTDADIPASYAYPASSTLETNIEAIIVQKWASLFGAHALEAFFERNRTGYPKTSPFYSSDPEYRNDKTDPAHPKDHAGEFVYSANGVTGPGNFPQRFLFPDDEKSRNTNTPAEVPIYTKVWWGK